MPPRFLSAIPQFPVADVVQTARYYRDVLGFQIAGLWDGEQVVHEPLGDAHIVFAIVVRDDVRIHFNLAQSANIRSGRAEDAPDAYINVTDVDALADEFRARGAHIVDGPEDRVYGQREVVVEDCNGLILCFAEATA